MENREKVLIVTLTGGSDVSSFANVMHQTYGHDSRVVGVIPNYSLIEITTTLIDWSDEIIFINTECYTLLNDVLKDYINNTESPSTTLDVDYTNQLMNSYSAKHTPQMGGTFQHILGMEDTTIHAHTEDYIIFEVNGMEPVAMCSVLLSRILRTFTINNGNCSNFVDFHDDCESCLGLFPIEHGMMFATCNTIRGRLEILTGIMESTHVLPI